MTVTISEFRKSLFQLVEKAGEGEKIEFSYKGQIYTVVPQKKRSRLDGLVGLPSSGLPSSGLTQEAFEQFRREESEAYDKHLDEEWS